MMDEGASMQAEAGDGCAAPAPLSSSILYPSAFILALRYNPNTMDGETPGV